jgi:hypothetical protein
MEHLESRITIIQDNPWIYINKDQKLIIKW